ncbi:MAG: iron-sulfur cluster biosynthesis transcriptional regulator SufR [Synechococcus sp. SB0665_bin_28]|uniref:Iron-sulfur cluster biosynthesis transcriptional regulator SufR n=1 Tax=Synechococcus sp. SB0676_bin_10 TaxID=2604869 RepID=A0A6B1F8T1_9SYNE|nr:iron-sulfur cluster biosynthesis transcriptional regulator SufR [Synechococcus sp. SB0664_bin_36]MXY62415.1 iron-sulfur cluster biosynthesis transcriptional regulator SufR [Synechococcus sp. SB0665_bin_28]MYF21000.1 iron-sulfur cluster biosynthesis transcriptional regulator SufR [Synechococcus sp. SB0677_bin_5]MYG38125.1 iron-sulfur cluster biosynthesis transcriptional regulator SufR [Synechococcus sp. SB0676_bin_10]MYK07144.1 iron-sulfur cluster biosynthesis transcriptional regulator SufR [
MSSEPVTSTREAALTILLRLGQATATSMASQLGVSVQVMRRHLRSLEQEGLVESSCNTTGPGRPSNLWRLTARGRDHFPDGSEEFARGLLHTVAHCLGPEQLQTLLGQQAAAQAQRYRRLLGDCPLEKRLQRLVELRRREGYVADYQPCQDRRSWLLKAFHCSVARIAEQFPVICSQELQLYRSIFPDCHVERFHWIQEGDHYCGFRVQQNTTADWKQSAASAPPQAPQKPPLDDLEGEAALWG